MLTMNSFFFQERLLFAPTLPQIDKNPQRDRRNDTQREEKIKWCRIVSVRCSLYNSRRNEGTDEGRGLADDAEQGKEEEFVATGSHLGDHYLGVAVPGADTAIAC